MKKLVFILISFPLIWGTLLAQSTLSDTEKIAAYIRSHTEEDVRKLFNSNGYTVFNVIKGYPECLDGYVFYSNRLQMEGGGEPETFPSEMKVFAIEKGKINSIKSFEKLRCEIAFTLTAKDNNLADSECIIFIGTNGFAYNYNVNNFNIMIPMVLDIGVISFPSNTVKKNFRFSVSDNVKKENNKSYDFSGFSKTLNCQPVLNYEFISEYSNGMASVFKNNKWGFIDSTKKEIVAPQYDGVCKFNEGLAWVEKNGLHCYIDKTGKEVTPYKYERSFPIKEGMALVQHNSLYGFIDNTGKEVIPIQYEYATEFSEGLALVRTPQKSCFIDKTGKEVIALQYQRVDVFSNGLARVCQNNLYGYIDKTGKIVISPKYDENSGNFSCGFAKVKLDNKYGFIDNTGNLVIAPTYEQAGDFSEGMASVKLNGKFGYINTTGEVIIPFQYVFANNFSGGYAPVMFNYADGLIYIDKTGKKK